MWQPSTEGYCLPAILSGIWQSCSYPKANLPMWLLQVIPALLRLYWVLAASSVLVTLIPLPIISSSFK